MLTTETNRATDPLLSRAMSSRVQSRISGSQSRSGARGKRAAEAAPPAAAAPSAAAAEADEAALRVFDLTPAFGPTSGMTRLERWARADALGLKPPPAVRALLEARGAGSAFNQQVFADGKI